MSVVSYSFLLFLLIVCMVYYIVPKKWQWVVLLAAGIVFYAGAGVSYLAVVGLTALVVYGCSLLMQKIWISRKNCSKMRTGKLLERSKMK